MAHKPKHEKPSKSEKTKVRQRLVAKGVDMATAKHISGEDDDIDREQIAATRIEWQRQLPKA